MAAFDVFEPLLEHLRILHFLQLLQFLLIILIFIEFLLVYFRIQGELVVAADYHLVRIFLLSKPINKILHFLKTSLKGKISCMNKQIPLTHF